MAEEIQFDFRDVRNPSIASDDELKITIGGQSLAPIALASVTSSWDAGRTVAIPPSLVDDVHLITFQVDPGVDGLFQSIVVLDNIDLLLDQATGNPDIGSVVQAFNDGISDVRQAGQISNLANIALGADLPLIEESVAQISDAADRLATPFLTDIQTSSSLSEVSDALSSLGFQVEYLDILPDASGDLLRATYQQVWNTPSVPVDFGLSTGFEYFDAGVDGSLAGSLSAALQPVSLSMTLGVDLENGVPTFYVSEDSSLTVGGISLTGSVQANLGIRNLLDVDVAGAVTGSLGGSLAFVDGDFDNKLRSRQLANPASIVQSTLGGSIDFTPTMTAHLPIIGQISWNGTWSASILNGTVDIGAPTLSPPVDGHDSTASRNRLSNSCRRVRPVRRCRSFHRTSRC